jgi:high-affinity iron transporter
MAPNNPVRLAAVSRWLIALLCAWALSAHAQTDSGAQTIVHILDYVGVDYGGAVEAGRVKDASEYKEMLEFTSQVRDQIEALPANPRRSELLTGAQQLERLVKAKADITAVSDAATQLRWAVIAAYDIPVSPKRAPDLKRGAALYTQMCAACHGAQGRGDGLAARGMDPPPANFHDAQRMAGRSVYGLYNTITLGVGGTPMTAFRQLSEEDRWALAFYVANIGVSEAQREQGQALWKAGEVPGALKALRTVATLSRNEVSARYGENAALVYEYLRGTPESVVSAKAAPLAHARDTLAATLEAYSRGEAARAQTLAVSAYLEGFELIEPSLDAVDHDLRVAIETDMLRLRTLLREGAEMNVVKAQVVRINDALQLADEKLGASSLSPAGAAVSAFIILLREGLEAILVLAAIIAFLVKAQRRDALRYIHAGWIGALALGALTWFAASYLINVSGAGREMTEGITALFSAAILLYVGWWLHDKSHAQAWKQFISDKLAGALSSGTIWALASLSFLAVYREVFESVLFYEALWAQTDAAGHGSILGGMLAGAATLALVAWLIFRYGVRLPIGVFFGVSSAFLAVLAVVFAGQGIGALQEAGAVNATLIDFPRIPSLGIFPTVQSLLAQLAVFAAIVAVLAWSRRGSRTKHG